MSQISLVTSMMSRPDFMISEGLVVTPSTMPRSLSSADGVGVGGVDEEFHGRLPWLFRSIGPHPRIYRA
jgi:hypothetical protein